MSELPAGWAEATLGDIAAWSSGGTPSRSNAKFYGGDIPWFKTGELGPQVIHKAEEHITSEGLASSSAKLFPKGSVGLAMYGATIGKASIFGIEATTNQACAVGVPLAVSSEFLFYFLSSQTQAFIDAGKGGAQPNISQGIVKEWPVYLPPAAEQTRIVAKLEELLSDFDAGVAELKAAQRKLTQYRQSLLKAAVEGALTAEWRAARANASSSSSPRRRGSSNSEHKAENTLDSRPRSSRGQALRGDDGDAETGAQLLDRILKQRRARWEARQLAKFKEQGKAPPKDWQAKYPEPVKPDTTDLPSLPEGWVWSSIGQCFHVAVGATPSRKEPSYWNGPIPWVSSGEVQFTRITTTKESITEEGLNNSSTQINPVGSVMLGMIGEGKTRGQVSILDIEATNNQNCAAIWVSETDIPSEYVYYWLWSRYEQTRKGSSGNNQPALNKSIVERIPFPLPPLQEVREVTRRLGVTLELIQDLEAETIISFKQSAAQRKNILKAAFAGQLVPQDPNDEPASVLLERIRAGRAKLPAVKKQSARMGKEKA